MVAKNIVEHLCGAIGGQPIIDFHQWGDARRLGRRWGGNSADRGLASE
jgi:hypothetical protein